MYRPIHHLIYTTTACIALTALLPSCKNKSASSDERREYVISDMLLKTIKIDTVKSCPLENALLFTGQVDFNQDKVVNVFPLISGVIQDIKVVLGDYVEKGQVLGTVKSSEMAQFSSDLLNAQTNLNLAQQTLSKTIDLYKSGLASKTDSLGAAIALQQAKAEVTRAQRVLSINGNNTQGEWVITAPISGFIVQKGVTNNQAIRTDNGNALFTISDLKEVWVWANVYESNVENIHMGDNVEVTTLSKPNRIFNGKVDKIMQMLDPASKAMKVRVVIANDQYALKPQMFASVTITSMQNKQALCIPNSALIFDHSQYFVLEYSGKGKANIIPVQKMNSIGSKTYLSGGVTEGQRIIGSSALQIYSDLNN